MKRGGYGSFCPVAKAAEILTERWTLLVLRDLLLGSRHFNDLRRGVPQMSPTLLSKRLHTLEEAGIVLRKPAANGHWEYHPTKAAEELKPLIELVGHWGQRWVRSKLTRDELHPGALMWFIHRHFKKDDLPPGRVVIYIEITDAKRLNRWWLVAENKTVDLCLDDPGHEVDISLYTDLLTLTQIYIGDTTLTRARDMGKVRLYGPRELTATMPRWFARSKFADDNPLPAAIRAAV
ncbi:MAG TPA: helix-turn-helix domain-containing protein [Burkholderiales bacterium]|nr:helix-turn-helix domain-containing protein [Burkholderiales bacterium]